MTTPPTVTRWREDGSRERVPWGWGAVRVEPATPGSLLPCCWHFVRRPGEVGVHTYPDGTRRCTPCAEEFCREQMKEEAYG